MCWLLDHDSQTNSGSYLRMLHHCDVQTNRHTTQTTTKFTLFNSYDCFFINLELLLDILQVTFYKVYLYTSHYFTNFFPNS